MPEVSEKLGITLVIAGRPQYITVPRDKEHHFREATALINEKYNKYRQNFQNQDLSKYDTAVMLDISVRLVQMQEDGDKSPIIDTVDTLTKEIEDVLGENV